MLVGLNPDSRIKANSSTADSVHGPEFASIFSSNQKHKHAPRAIKYQI